MDVLGGGGLRSTLLHISTEVLIAIYVYPCQRGRATAVPAVHSQSSAAKKCLHTHSRMFTTLFVRLQQHVDRPPSGHVGLLQILARKHLCIHATVSAATCTGSLVGLTSAPVPPCAHRRSRSPRGVQATTVGAVARPGSRARGCSRAVPGPRSLDDDAGLRWGLPRGDHPDVSVEAGSPIALPRAPGKPFTSLVP